MQRVILSNDMNGFYVSVEIMLDPSIRGKAVAVCATRNKCEIIMLGMLKLASFYGGN